jgi:ribosomal protein L7/L12
MYQNEIQSLMDRMAALAARVVELEDKVSFLLMHEPTPYVPASLEEKAGNEAAVVELLNKGNTMEALKLYRQKHNVGLDEAKKAIADLRNKFAG